MTVELVVGLGNPGPQYADTRHNVGYRVVERLGLRHDASWERRRECLVAVLSDGRWLIRPTTFMNRSGDAVGALVAERGLEAAAVLVVVDDIDLGIGSLRLRPSGGPGTHNGLRDICDAIGTGFARLRLGIRGADPLGDLADYVLAPFPAAEIEDVETMLDRAVEAVECACREGIAVAMNLYNRRPESSPDPAT